jgi:predicted GNAT family acetyltransferase
MHHCARRCAQRHQASARLPFQWGIPFTPEQPGGALVSTGVVDRPEKSRFELPVGDDVAVAYYKLDGDRLTLTHTEVPDHLSGQGIGSRLAKGAFEAIRASGRKAAAKCPFMASYAKRHP